MKITVIYGTGRKKKSTTYNLAQVVIDKLKEDDEVYEFFLPKDMNHFCIGCYQCIDGKSDKCPGYDMVNPIREAISKSELIIFAVPVYVFHIPGQVKALLDHFAYEWMVHRPDGNRFNKQALLISVAAGLGLKSTIRDLKHSMDFWGIGQVYTYKKAIFKGHWPEVEEKNKEEMKSEILKIADKIYSKKDKVKPRLKVKLMFYMCKFMHKAGKGNPVDYNHWKTKGWLDNVKPWQN